MCLGMVLWVCNVVVAVEKWRRAVFVYLGHSAWLCGVLKKCLFIIHVYILECMKASQLLILWSSGMNMFKCSLELLGFCIFEDELFFHIWKCVSLNMKSV